MTKVYKKLKAGAWRLRVGSGSPLPLGPEQRGRRINFSVFSANASRVFIVFYESGTQEPACELELEEARHRTGDLWHIEVAGLPKGFKYGYRMEGPLDPENGHRFDAETILMDPYSRALSGGAVWGSPLVRKGKGETPSSRYLRRSFLAKEDFDWGGDRPINRPLKDSIIYELHVRGYTIDPSANVQQPGTFAGLTEKIPYLKDLGVTAVELMPVHEFDELDNLYSNPETGEPLRNFWGYNPIAFFAPKASYAAGGMTGSQVEEFKHMVRAFHRAGIEVILDVVFNHTGEGGEGGPSLSFRGMENSVYYMLNDAGDYMNFSGCGNTVNCNHSFVRRFIVDCLHYWVAEVHIDGFRFDLASVLGRDQEGNVLQNPPILEEIANDPLLAGTKIIAEAWDAAGLYQVGSFPAWGRWAEWNGRYRDDLRRFLRGDGNCAGDFATRLAGSSDLYRASGRHPYHSINFITSHDGFTLNDLVSYNCKHNRLNGEDGRDGDNNNESYNWGIEGPADDPGVERRRKRAIRNAFTSLMVSQGTPMILAGDEFRRTQQGNNNCYCQDNELSWVDWSLLEQNRDLQRFVKLLIAMRRKHPALRRDYFFTGEDLTGCGFPDISWHGTEPWQPDFSGESRVIGALICGEHTESGAVDSYFYIAANMSTRVKRMKIPLLPKGKNWYVKVDTAAPAPADIYQDGDEPAVQRNIIFLRPGSMMVLLSGGPVQKPE